LGDFKRRLAGKKCDVVRSEETPVKAQLEIKSE